MGEELPRFDQRSFMPICFSMLASVPIGMSLACRGTKVYLPSGAVTLVCLLPSSTVQPHSIVSFFKISLAVNECPLPRDNTHSVRKILRTVKIWGLSINPRFAFQIGNPRELFHIVRYERKALGYGLSGNQHIHAACGLALPFKRRPDLSVGKSRACVKRGNFQGQKKGLPENFSPWLRFFQPRTGVRQR